MAKLSVRCPRCGNNLVPIGDVVKHPKDPDKVCCIYCKKVWLPHELQGSAGSMFKKDMVPVEQDGEVPW